MKIPMAFLADEANFSQDGKLNALGMFDRISASELPVVHPRMVFCFRVHAEAADAGRVLPVQVLLVDDDGAVLFEANGEITPPPVPPGEFSTANQVFTLVGVQLPRAGLYRFVVNIDGLPPHETPFIVSTTASDPTLN